jgi:hypothetical protein
LFVWINYRENSSTVDVVFRASEKGVASGFETNVGSVASDGCIDTSSCRGASINGANRAVVTSGSNIERSENTSGAGVARVIGTFVVVITNNGGLDTRIGVGVARIDDAFAVGIANFRSGLAFSISWVADVDLAWNSGTGDVIHFASITVNGGASATIGGSVIFRASEGVARIWWGGSAVSGKVDTTDFGIARIDGAFLVIVTVQKGVVFASRGRIARVDSASIAIIANFSGELASSSILGSIASWDDAFAGSFTKIRAEALLVASAESMASSSASISDNVVTSGKSQSTENSVQSAEVGGKESKVGGRSNVVNFSGNSL